MNIATRALRFRFMGCRVVEDATLEERHLGGLLIIKLLPLWHLAPWPVKAAICHRLRERVEGWRNFGAELFVVMR